MTNKRKKNMKMAMFACRRRSKRNNRGGVESDYYVPCEIWSEILLKLPIKSLLLCRSVCKLWRSIGDHICKNCAPLPFCGFINVLHLNPEPALQIGYLDATQIESESESLGDREVVTKAECDTTLLPAIALRFDSLDLSDVKRNSTNILSHKGLLLIRHRDYSFKVHNPVTNEVYNVPLDQWHTHGQLFINLSEYHPGSKCRFVIVRFQPSLLDTIIVYYSETQEWTIGRIKLATQLPDVSICREDLVLRNYIADYETQSRTISFLLLTRKRCGVALKLKLNRTRMILSSFPIPKQSNYIRNRLWRSQGNLFLSYHFPLGVSLWKLADARDWTWALQLEIMANSPKSSKSVLGRENLWEAIKAAHAVDDRQRTLMMGDPNSPIIYFVSPRLTFGYDHTNDNLFKINDGLDPSIGTVYEMFPFIPCLCSFDASDVNVNTQKTMRG